MFLWSRVLERYLSGDLIGAVETLHQARKQNPHVEPFLASKAKLPKTRPDYYGIGDMAEAITCMDAIGPAWKKHREAIQWLKRNMAAATSLSRAMANQSSERPRTPDYGRGFHCFAGTFNSK